ncbi:MAG: FtsK/SpoIIIE domain-containing protein [Chloroflexota bacterium]|nr:FtsK/SpoIIIE domain-containing protein [Chloroflexota bacterium]
MALQDVLDKQANSIEYVLHTHGIRIQVDGGRLSPRLAHFHLLLPPGVRPQQLSPFVQEIASVLGVQSCRLQSGESGIHLEVPRPDPVPVRLLPLVQRVADIVPPVTATLGLDCEGTPLLLRLNSPDVDSVFISGGPRAGKSSLLKGMSLSLSLHNSPERVRLLLISLDGDDAAFGGLENLPHLACPLANGPADALLSLRWAERTLSRRSQLDADELTFDDGDDALLDSLSMGAEEPDLIVMIDGAERLGTAGNARFQSEALPLLNRLLADGPKHGIHLVLSSAVAALPGINSGWGARISGWVHSPEAARLATGVKGSGAHSLLGEGDFVISLNAELIRFQAGSITDGEVRKALELIRQGAMFPQPSAKSEDLSTEDQWYGYVSNEPVPLRRLWSGQ